MESFSVEAIAAEFVERIRSGEAPTIDEYRHRFPELAEEIGDLFPMLAKLEQLAPHLHRSEPSRHEPLAGDQVGPYQLSEELGRGGMAVVFDAIDARTGKQVAVKVMSDRMLTTPQMLDRFDREVRSASRLHHTHIVPILDSGETDGVRFLVMERIEGASLSSVMMEVATWKTCAENPPSAETQKVSDSTTSLYGRTSEERLTSPEFFRRVARLGAQVADAVAHAHHHGVFHRDIKPSNILVDVEGNAWVTDFGLAKTEEDNLTQTGDIVGTPRYMAPERLRGRFTPASDVFGIGATLYELIALRPAFDQTDQLALIRQIEQSRPVRISQICAAVPNDLEVIVSKAMSKEPAERYATAADLAEDLKRFLHGDEIRARRPGIAKSAWKWMTRNPVTAATVCGVFLTLTLGLVFSTHNWRRANRFLEQSIEETARANRERHRAEVAEKKHAEVARQQEDLAERARESLALIARLQQSGEVLEPDVIEAIHAVSGDTNLDVRERLLRMRAHNANLMILCGRKSEALQEFSQIASEVEVQSQSHPSEEMTIAWLQARMSVGFLQNKMGRAQEAIRTYRQTLEDSGLVLVDEAGPAMRDAVARIQHNLGYAYVVQREFAKAEELYHQVIATRREISRVADGNLALRQATSLAQVYGDLAYCFQEAGRVHESLRWRQECLDARRALADRFPEDPRHRDRLAKAHNHLADAHRVLTRDLFLAAQQYTRGLLVRGDLVDEYPRRIEYRHHRANDYGNLGSVWTMLGDYGRAAAALREAIDDYKAELAIDDRNAMVRSALAAEQIKLGRALCLAGDERSSKQQFQQALSHLHQCASEVPNNRQFQRKLGDCFGFYLDWFDRYRTADQKHSFIEQMVSQEPEVPEVLERAAHHLLTDVDSPPQRLENALRYAERAAGLSDAWRTAHTLGVAHLRCGHLQKAEQLLEKSVRRARGRARSEALLIFAQCLFETGEVDRANLCYEEALRNWLKIPYVHTWIRQRDCELHDQTRERLSRLWTPLELYVDIHLLRQDLTLTYDWLRAMTLLPETAVSDTKF